MNHLNKVINEIETYYQKSDAEVSYWQVGNLNVSYGSKELSHQDTSRLQKDFPINILRCTFVYRAPNTYYAPHKDRGDRAAAILFNISKDRSSLNWYPSNSFGKILSSASLSEPTLIDTQRAYHGIQQLSAFWRKTFQIEFADKSYSDLYQIFNTEVDI